MSNGERNDDKDKTITTFGSEADGKTPRRQQAQEKKEGFESSFEYIKRRLNISGNMDWTAKFTGILCFLAFLQWLTFENTDMTLRDQLSASLNDQRPWVKLVLNGIRLSFSSGNIAYDVSYGLKNVGKNPAFDTYASIQIVPAGSPRETQDKICDLAEEFMKILPMRRFVIFPSDESQPQREIGSVKLTDEFKVHPIGGSSPADALLPQIYGCVIYRERLDRPIIRHTRVAFQILKPDDFIEWHFPQSLDMSQIRLGYSTDGLNNAD